ncbi:MAG: ABC transporter substrate-binding protein [Planctomycetes bacterium]|nr:ABC transporter substrate-binding protein [Planctomycetota bacterium]
MSQLPTFFRLACGALTLLALQACDPKPAAGPTPTTTPGASVEDDVHFTTEGKRIVAANTAAAEYLYFLVPADRVAAVPEQVGAYSSVSFADSGWENVERLPRYSADPVLAARADLVVTHPWQEPETTSLLRKQDVPVLVLVSANGWDDIARNMRTLGRVLHREKRAETEILRRGNTVERLARDAAKRPKLRALVYSNDGNGGWAASKGTTADAVLRMAGLGNAATEAGLTGHAQVDFDRLLVLDPDVLVLTEAAKGQATSTTLATLQGAPAAQSLRALKENKLVFVPDALLSSDSPTMVDAADLLALRVDDLLAGRKQ